MTFDNKLLYSWYLDEPEQLTGCRYYVGVNI